MKIVNIKTFNVLAIIALNELCGRFSKPNIIGCPPIHSLLEEKLVFSEGRCLPNVLTMCFHGIRRSFFLYVGFISKIKANCCAFFRYTPVQVPKTSV